MIGQRHLRNQPSALGLETVFRIVVEYCSRLLFSDEGQCYNAFKTTMDND